MVDATLAEVVRAAREREGISLRELARRARVSAGQISRIEAGEVAKPSSDTLRSIARALGRYPDPLLVIAGHLTGEAAGGRLLELQDEIEERDEPAASFLDAGARELAVEDEASRRYLAWTLFEGSRADLLGWGFQRDEDDETRKEVEELIRAWRALTPERRLLVRALVADQEVLSRLDRLPSAPGRYEIDIRLTDREATDAD